MTICDGAMRTQIDMKRQITKCKFSEAALFKQLINSRNETLVFQLIEMKK